MISDETLVAAGNGAMMDNGFDASKLSWLQFSSGENATVASISSRKPTTNLYSLCHWEITSRA
jgi:hypothetical protein